MSDHEQDGLPFGEAPDGRLISVADVPSGIACGMVCPQCRMRLVAKKGAIIRHHFAHEAEFACSGAAETLLHKLAKQIIADAKGVWLPSLVATYGNTSRTVAAAGWFALDTVELEVWRDGIRPDIIGRRGDRELAVEVLVTHACGPDKLAFIADRRMAAIEIDLSALRALMHGDGIENAVLRSAPRQWLFNAKLAPVVEELRIVEMDRRRRQEEAQRRHDARMAIHEARRDARAKEESARRKAEEEANLTDKQRQERLQREAHEAARIELEGWFEQERKDLERRRLGAPR